MAKMIQVRNVSERLHRELSRRARNRGQSLTTYIEEILEREVSRPSREELEARIRSREPVDVSVDDIVGWIREDRGPLPEK
jgi:plasmid stability protein